MNTILIILLSLMLNFDQTSIKSEFGVASYYGPGFHGKKTASGEIFNQNALTAAHKTLPLGTYVTVTNLDNCKYVRVKINDRGPFIKGRIIDLSSGAATVLGYKNKGTANVQIEFSE